MEKDIPSWFEFIKSSLSASQVVGIDYSQYPASALETRTKFFKEANLTVQNVPNLVDLVWADERPARPVNPVKVLEDQFSGKTSLDKQAQIADKLKDAKFEALLVTTLDDICWITNLRGTDIEYNPVFFSFALFFPKRPATESRVLLFIDDSKVEHIRDYLTSQKIETQPYQNIDQQLKTYVD